MASSDADFNPFGDSSLFKQFDDERNHIQSIEHVKSQDPDKNKLLTDLKKENDELKRRLRLLEPPSEGQFTSADDSPVIQVIFMHHDKISKKRQVVEDFIQQLVMDSEAGKENPAYDQLLPQRSALRIRGSNVTFLATGSVQYYNYFCLDILGRPLVDGEIALTEDWDIPSFERGFPDTLPFEEGSDKNARRSRPKPSCFNCGEEGHSLRDCTAERDFAKISAAKQQFQQQQSSSPGLHSKRYHKDTDSDQKYAAFKPGVVSDELRKAMGLAEQALPHYIYTMRMLGYPPGYLKEAEITSSGLAVYDTLKDEDGEIKDVHDKPLRYIPAKLIKYPGFNVSPPEEVKDDHQTWNMPPMQHYHQYDAFHSFMSSRQPAEGSNDRSKRKGEFSESDDNVGRKKSRVQEVKEMEIGSPHSPASSSSEGGSRGFWLDSDNQGSPFRPPLPPTPGVSELPPLPPSTPPATPPVRTPRDTPLSSLESTPVPSPSVSSGDGIIPDTRESQDSDTSMSLDELVGQQRALMTKLNDAAAGGEPASDSDVVVISSSDRESGVEGETQTVEEAGAEEVVGGTPDMVVLDDAFESADSTNSILKEEDVTEGAVGGTEGSKAPGEAEDQGPQNGGTAEMPEDDPTEEEELPNKSGVPHRSNFADGITPHVDENVSASKGVFQKILGLLKTSKDQKSS